MSEIAKLEKEQIAKKAQLIANLKRSHEELCSTIDAFNELAQEEYCKIESKKEEFDDAQEQWNTFCDEIAEGAQEYFNEKNEKWQEGKAGSAHESWIEEWQQAQIGDIDIEEFREIDHPDEPEVFSEEPRNKP